MINCWEIGKIAAAFFAAFLVIFTGQKIVHISPNNSYLEGDEVGYKLPVDLAATGKSSKHNALSISAGLDFMKIATLMQTASVDSGASVFKKCGACHTPEQGAKNGMGPNLWNIVNRDIGSIEGFKYSDAILGKRGNWTYEKLALFLHKPKKWLKGTKMAFGGLRREQDIASVLIYLRSLSDSPAPLPAVQ